MTDELERLRVELGDRAYEILVGPQLIERAGREIQPLLRRRQVVIVSDETVAQHCLPQLHDSLGEAGIAHHTVLLPPGEETKDLDHFGRLAEEILAFGIERGSMLVALGGGAASRNPVVDVERPAINRDEGSTAAFSKAQARKLLDAPPTDTLAGLRDRAILSVGLQVGFAGKYRVGCWTPVRLICKAHARVPGTFLLTVPDDDGVPVRCTQNPTAGEEWRRDWHPERVARAPLRHLHQRDRRPRQPHDVERIRDPRDKRADRHEHGARDARLDRAGEIESHDELELGHGCDEVALVQAAGLVVDEHDPAAHQRGHEDREHDRARQQVLDVRDVRVHLDHGQAYVRARTRL